MRSIRSILFIRMALLAFGSLGVLAAAVYVLSSRMITRFYLEDHAGTATFLSENVSSNYLAHLKNLERLAERLAPFARAKAEAELDSFLRNDGIYSTVHTYSASGDIVVARKRGQPDYRSSGNYHSKNDRAYIDLADAVLSENRPRVSDPFRTASGALYQTYLVPVRGPDSRPQALLSGGVDLALTDVSYLIRGGRFGADNFVVVADRHGRFLAQDHLPSSLRESTLQSLFPRDDGRPDPAPVWLHLESGEDFHVFARGIPELRWVVYFGASTHRIDEKRAVLLKAFLLVLPLGLLAAFGASWLLAARLATPLRQAIEGLDRLRDGDYSYRIGYPHDDELGALCGSIDELGRRIQKARYLGYLWAPPSQDRDP